MSQPPHAKAWLRQREAGAVVVAKLEAQALRELSMATALAQSEALLLATPFDAIDPARRSSSGLVEQQRLFARARR